MLVLSRQVQEGLWIGDRIFVRVLVVGRRRVKLGIEAPIDCNIVRAELRRQADEESEEREQQNGEPADEVWRSL